MSFRLIQADCVEAMAAMEPNSVDAIVTDPPYDISFMGRTWDSFRGDDIDPGFLHWFAGFTDGEGCFSVHKKNVNGHETYDCQFSISLRADDRPILERIHRTLGIGTLSKPTAHRTGSDNPKARYSVSAKAELAELRAIFRAFPLRAKKATDFELWSDALDAWIAHEPNEWAEMAELRSTLMDSRAYKPEGVRVDPFQMWTWRWGREALRVLKPGGHALVFGGTRRAHRMTAGLEDAGFEIRDCLAWMYGSGFPKSLDVSKAIDKAAGAEREVVGTKHVTRVLDAETLRRDNYTVGVAASGGDVNVTAPATPEAQHWNGWGTALKPAFEPVVLARKPLSERNVAANVLRWGTGALNIDGCRIDADDKTPFPKAGYGRHASDASYQFAGDPNFNTTGDDAHPTGRWPANVTLDETAAAMLDEQSGERASSGLYQRAITGPREGAASIPLDGMDNPQYADAGGASRFFKVVATDGPDGDNQRATGLASDGRTPSTGVETRNGTSPSVATRFLYCPKADRAERNNGLGHMTPKARPGAFDDDAYEWAQDGGHVVARPSPNHHPTVKPIALMAWLCRMVTPKGGTVLDPFTGSGSTGIAALREGFEFIGVEREAEYVEIARARIIGDAPLWNTEVEEEPA